MSKPKRKPAIDFQKIALTRSRHGTRVHRTGVYALFRLTGERYDESAVTFSKGDTFPDTPERNLLWGLVDTKPPDPPA